jgi:hypothetical protein
MVVKEGDQVYVLARESKETNVSTVVSVFEDYNDAHDKREELKRNESDKYRYLVHSKYMK